MSRCAHHAQIGCRLPSRCGPVHGGSRLPSRPPLRPTRCRHCRHGQRPSWWPAVALLLRVAACTSAELVPADGAEPLTDRVALSGEVCTVQPEEVSQLLRILFAVDSSDSMLFNDPNNLLVDGVQSITKRFAGQAAVSYGVLRWGNRVVREMTDYSDSPDAPLYTNDSQVLEGVFSRMRQPPAENNDRYLGGTNYELAIDKVREYIMEDQARNPELRGTAKYVTFFVTDGMPQATDQDPEVTRETVVLKVEQLAAQYEARLDVLYVGVMSTIPEVFIHLLPDMARAGSGEYVLMSNPQDLQHHLDRLMRGVVALYEYELGTVSTAQDTMSLLISNENVRLKEIYGNKGIYVDSDGDGLVDDEELDLDSDPTLADTDGDGLDDYFEQVHAGDFNALAARRPELSDDQLADEDNDGLIFFAEEHMGTDPLRADTDGDGISDRTEFLVGTDPLEDDARRDYDLDGLTNGVEILQHTNPRLDEGEKLRGEFSYVTTPIEGAQEIVNGRRCYWLRVSNIALRQTMASVGMKEVQRPEGYNHLEVTMVQRPLPPEGEIRTEDELPSRVTRGGQWIIYRSNYPFRDPPALELWIQGGVK